MDEQEKRKAIIEWFEAPKPSLPIKAILVAIVLIGLGVVAHWSMIVAGVFVLVIAIAIYSSAKSRYDARPTDDQMDSWREEDMATLRTHALDKFGFDEDDVVGDPVFVTGLKFGNVAGARWRHRVGQDGVVRYTPIATTCIDLGEHQLLCFGCVYDLTTGKPLNEETDEYFYRDVVSVSTKSKSQTVNFQEETIQLTAAETFELTTSGGTSVSVVLSDPAFVKKLGGSQLWDSRAEKAVKAIRKMLREKKSAMA